MIPRDVPERNQNGGRAEADIIKPYHFIYLARLWEDLLASQLARLNKQTNKIKNKKIGAFQDFQISILCFSKSTKLTTSEFADSECFFLWFYHRRNIDEAAKLILELRSQENWFL